MRIVIELRRDAYPQVVLNNLFKLTPLQNNFSAYMLALVKGEPVLLTLRKMLEVFLDFRVETIERRTRYLLRKAEERDHILLGLLLALDQLDPIIALIRAAPDTATARQQLQERHGLRFGLRQIRIARAAHNRNQAQYPIRVPVTDHLGDHRAHGRAADVGFIYAQGIEQPHGVVSHFI